MAERKQVDWESVERDYSAGLLSLREIAAKHNVSHQVIARKAKTEDWSRDLGAKIAAAVEKKLGDKQLGDSLGDKKRGTEKEVVEANAQVIVEIKVRHRLVIKKLNGLLDSQMDEIEALNKEKSVENLPMRVDVTKKIADTVKTMIDKERQAFGIVDVPTPTENAITELVKVCQGNSVSITTSANDFDEDEDPLERETQLIFSLLDVC